MSETLINQERLAHLQQAIAADVAARRYYGAVIAVARRGRVVMHEAIGYADAARTQPLQRDSVFSIFSVTKALTNVLVLRAIELGRFALTTRVSELVPAFSGRGREAISIFHLLTHTSGLPIVFAIKPDMYIDRLDEMVAAVCDNIFPAEPPGEGVAYSPLANHVLLGEALRRTDPQRRSYRAIVQQTCSIRCRCAIPPWDCDATCVRATWCLTCAATSRSRTRGTAISGRTARFRRKTRRCRGWGSRPRSRICCGSPRCSAAAVSSTAHGFCHRRR